MADWAGLGGGSASTANLCRGPPSGRGSRDDVKPLDSYETVVNYIRTTKNSSGLRVKARLIQRNYETGERIPQKHMQQLTLTRHMTLPNWNYTLAPSQM